MHGWFSIFKIGNKPDPNIAESCRIFLGNLHLFAFSAKDCSNVFQIYNRNPIFILFGILLIWFAFFGGYVSNIRRRLRGQKDKIKTAHEELKIEIEERKRIQMEKEDLIVELKDALAKIRP